MELYEIRKIKGNKTKAKRIGRGRGSGKGSHTVGFGTKGQKSRTGNSIPNAFEGGQVPLFKKLPRIRGFNKSYTRKPLCVNVSAFEVFENGTAVTPQVLLDKGILRKLEKRREVKILGNGDFSKKLNFSGFLYSESAKSKVEKSGSTIDAGAKSA